MSRKAAASKAARPKRSKLGRQVLEGLKLVEKHVKGEIELPVRHQPPEGAVRAYLLVIDRNPRAVESALRRTG